MIFAARNERPRQPEVHSIRVEARRHRCEHVGTRSGEQLCDELMKLASLMKGKLGVEVQRWL
jgi:hypothetical protein